MRRRPALLPLLLAAALIAAACGGPGSETRVPNANATNANAAGAREGTGPQTTGIGGTNENNRNAAVSGNSNVEPTGVNKNVGATPAANRNR